jgi:hypothetical protein
MLPPVDELYQLTVPDPETEADKVKEAGCVQLDAPETEGKEGIALINT